MHGRARAAEAPAQRDQLPPDEDGEADERPEEEERREAAVKGHPWKTREEKDMDSRKVYQVEL